MTDARSPRGGDAWRWTLALGWLIVLAGLTLTPASSTPAEVSEVSRRCLICGDRGSADAILNVILFAPLGIALAGRRRAALWAAVIGLTLSGAVELAQLWVPGRYTTLGDVVWNGLGGPMGVVAAAVVRGRLSWRYRGWRRWAGTAAAAATGALLVAAGWLLQTSSTRAPYYGQWTADLGSMPQYRGTLLAASLDGIPVPSSVFPPEARPRERLLHDWTLSAVVVKGTPPSRLSPIVSIYDEDEREIFLLGASGQDVVLRERMRATALRLDYPDLRVRHALDAVAVGDTMSLGARRTGEDRCIGVDGRETCGLGFTPGRSWSLLLYPEEMSDRALRVVDASWMFVLMIPFGFLSPSIRSWIANAASVGALVAIAIAATRLFAPPWWELAAGAVGSAFGWAAARWLESVVAPR